MAVQRDNPYCGFNFLVNLGDGDTNTVQAGFMEVIGLGAAISVIEYRNGNDRVGATRKLPGLLRTADIRLRRGLIGSTALFAWLQTAASGQPASRTVTISLQDEHRSNVVFSWRLLNAIPVSYAGPTLSAVASAVAMEELVLACQSIEVA
jgi:phage tail-like protein